MADLTIIYWRDIPAQVIAKQGRKTAKRELPARFSEAIDMAAMRAVFGRAALLVDRYFAAHMAAIGPDEQVRAVFAETQSAKTFVHLAAIRIVDRALTMSGGAGYMTKHPLSRLYRDVRAGPFMHPLGINLAYEFNGQVALGLEPSAV